MRLLVVSYTFPPDAEVGGRRIARLCRYLPQCGVQPIVLSVEERFYEARDNSVAVDAGLSIIRTRAMSTPLDWYRRVRRPAAQAATASQQGNFQVAQSSVARQQLLALLSFPDRQCGWYPPALKAADKLIKAAKVDAVFSSGPPWTSHLVARRLKIRHQLPWLADFRDPWAHLSPDRREPRWLQRVSEWLEDRCIASADLVICNTERFRQALQKQYSWLDAAKFRTLTNGFEDDILDANIAPPQKRIFLHLGSVYGLRRIDTFLEAIAELTRSGKLDASSFELIFQGEVSERFIAEAQQICPELVRNGCVQFRPRISWKDAQRLLASADRLLLFQGDQELQVPAKFYEYLQSGIPIFAVTEAGALSDLIDATGSGLWASPANSGVIVQRFIEFLEMPRRTPQSLRLQLSKFQYRHLASQLSDWMRALLQDRTGRRDVASAVTK